MRLSTVDENGSIGDRRVIGEKRVPEMDDRTYRASQRVVVTGAGGIVGRTIAETFQAAGAKVHVCDVDEAAILATAGSNPGMTWSVTNVGARKSISSLFADAKDSLGDINVLVNVVGIAGPTAAIEDTDIADWQGCLDINLSGCFYAIQEALSSMKKARRGAIINFSSGSTAVGLPLRAPYVVSKAGVEALTYNTAREVGPFGITCNAILPGAINNQRLKNVLADKAKLASTSVEELEKGLLRYISMRTKIEPAELAAAVMYLSSYQARHVTGQMLQVSGNVEWEA
jgi:NAD(P)-dependent dehydrogenase (short-subunit alcohol dehydrogenase family)